MPIYQYRDEDTGEIFEEIRSFKDSDKPFISKDGKKCKRLEIPTSVHGWKKNKEVFEADREYTKKMNPKRIKFRDGHFEKYDPEKHR